MLTGACHVEITIYILWLHCGLCTVGAPLRKGGWQIPLPFFEHLPISPGEA